MGQGAHGVNDAQLEVASARLERTVVGIREQLTGILRELARRRRALFDVSGMLRRHARGLVFVGLGTVGLVVALAWRRKRLR